MGSTVLVTDQVFGSLDIERAALAEAGHELREAPDAEEATLVELARESDALMVCFAQVNEPVVSAAAEGGGCRIIARFGIGVDNVDIEAATREGILVTNVADYCLDEVADHAMALLLAAARRVLPAALGVRSGDWTVPKEGVHRIRGRRLALLGVGRIGQRVASRARAFGIEVVGFDPFVSDWSELDAEPADSLEDAVAEADFVSLHAPLTPDTHHLVDDAAIAAMRRTPIVVNTSRGGLLDLDAATRALDDGRLAGLALDVTEVEPLPEDHPLRTHPRALITPHMSFHSAEASEDLRRRTVDEVLRALGGEPPRSPVNSEVLEEATT
jgi:D-3-phosphoglycerate dehydrogenase / 2-oxoglutarate reductase